MSKLSANKLVQVILVYDNGKTINIDTTGSSGAERTTEKDNNGNVTEVLTICWPRGAARIISRGKKPEPKEHILSCDNCKAVFAATAECAAVDQNMNGICGYGLPIPYKIACPVCGRAVRFEE